MKIEIKKLDKKVIKAFRLGILYAAEKYADDEVSNDRFAGTDVALFLEMESCELSDDNIAKYLKEDL